MPELPEVETVREGLSRLIVGKTINAVKHDWPKSFPNSKHDTVTFLIGAKVASVNRRAKLLIIKLHNNHALVIHLKMTGQLVYVAQLNLPKVSSSPDRQSSAKNSDIPTGLGKSRTDSFRFGAGHPTDSLIGKLPDKSTRVVFDFSDGSKLFFNDQRKFGWIRLMPTIEVQNMDFMKKVGPEPLAYDFTAHQFAQRIRRRSKSGIKAVLLDQTVIAGVGNIYADESLWASKINPSEIVETIADARLHKLFKELQAVLNLAIQKGGSTNKNYVNAEGKRGSYMDFARVFRRQNLPCPRCGTLIIKIKVASRGTHICPKCQKEHQ